MFKEFQPQGYPEDQLDKLVESGYEFDEKTNRYIMKSEVTKKKNNKNVTTDVILSAVKLKNPDTGKYIYYTCNPNINRKKIPISWISKQK